MFNLQNNISGNTILSLVFVGVLVILIGLASFFLFKDSFLSLKNGDELKGVKLEDGSFEKYLGAVNSGSREFAFSQNGQKIAYEVPRGPRYAVAVNGEVVSKTYSRVADFTFSPDGKRLVYYAADEKTPKGFAVEDTKEVRQYLNPQNFQFSADSSRIMYRGHKKGSYDNPVLVIDHTVEYNVGSHFAFSKDSKDIMGVACSGKPSKCRIEINGVAKSDAYNPYVIGGFAYSPNKQKLAMAVYSGNEGKRKDSVLENGKQLGVYDGTDSMTYTPDNKLMYVATTFGVSWDNNKRSVVVVVNGKRGTEYGNIFSTPIVDPAGHIVYLAGNNPSERFLVIDGKEGDHITGIANALQADNTGTRFVLRVKRGPKTENFIVIMDQAGKVLKELGPYDYATDPMFSSDGTSVLFGKANTEKGEFSAMEFPLK